MMWAVIKRLTVYWLGVGGGWGRGGGGVSSFMNALDINYKCMKFGTVSTFEGEFWGQSFFFPFHGAKQMESFGRFF